MDITEHRVTYAVLDGDALTAEHHGREFTVRPGAPATFPGDYRTHDAAPPA
ncbi:glycosyl hydrolase family 65 protein [Actinoplanes sp. NPDC023714]|uniref:glycosyl hydrolase family 65 protein n=1 Tax=Actinoplanes sp. NPDC023714 TaxID=3154322 RepID=UPI00340FE800